MLGEEVLFGKGYFRSPLRKRKYQQGKRGERSGKRAGLRRHVEFYSFHWKKRESIQRGREKSFSLLVNW